MIQDEIKKLNAKRMNEWQAPPFYHTENKLERRVKKNLDLDPFQIKVAFSSDQSLQQVGGEYLKITLQITDSIKYEHRFEAN